ncbi:MAG: STAS domain-containing protein [Oscillospiraceae bacterium]|nr:STAS domain-containing protein [Oscillospiraceae bacterium]
MNNKIRPILFDTLKGYSKKDLANDIVAGIIVAIIALPLSIALALASGVGPEQGIYTAIVAGFVIALLGGSHVQISGPTAAFATIVAGIVAESGMEGLVVSTVLAGIILIVMGVCRMGTLIKFIPLTITTGFTAGIAVTIVIGQLKDFFGVTYPAGMETIESMEKLHAFIAGFSSFNVHALIVGAVCLAVLIIMPRITEKIPGSLVAVIVGILMVQFLPLNVNTIGDLYTISRDLPKLSIPSFDYHLISTSLPNAFTIAILAAIESLLSCVVADGMIHKKHRSNTELVAQGIGNVASALFGGIPATGAIARTAANVKNGGRSPIAGMVHAVVLLLVLVLLMPYAGLIPMPTIAAILFMVAYNMSHWHAFVNLVKTAPRWDTAVLLITFVLTVVFDLVVAIYVGMMLACLLFMKRMSDETELVGWKYLEQLSPEQRKEEAKRLRLVPHSIRVYEISGPLFFGDSGVLDRIVFKDVTKYLVLRMRGVPYLDSTAMSAMHELYSRCQRRGITLILSHVNEQPRAAMERDGFVQLVGEENFRANIDEALAHAEALLAESEK